MNRSMKNPNDLGHVHWTKDNRSNSRGRRDFIQVIKNELGMVVKTIHHTGGAVQAKRKKVRLPKCM